MDNYYAQALANALGKIKTQSVNSEYTNAEGQPWSMKWKGLSVGDNGVQAGSYGNPVDPTYFADVYARLGDRQVIPNFDKTVQTPLGALQLHSNDEDYNSVGADFTPNEYVRALANMLRR